MAAWKALFPAAGAVAPAETEKLPSLEPVAANRDALAAAGLVGFAQGAAAAKQPLTLCVNDPHRITDTTSFLSAVFGLLDESIEAGSQPSYRMVVAQGSHKATAEEIAAHEQKLLGDAYRARVPEIAWHSAKDDGLVPVGSNSYHPWMAEAGWYLACGSLEPHYFAGVTGAHKTLTVGVWSYDSLRNNHAGSMHAGSGGLRLAGNPVYEGFAVAIGELAASGASMMVINQLVCNNKIVGVFADKDPLKALLDGVPLVTECFAAKIAGGALDLLVAEVEAPLNRDLYQADKGLKNTEFVIRDGGIILLDATCANGVGITHFVELMREAKTYDEAMALVESRGYSLGDHKAVKLRNLTEKRGVRVGLVSPAMQAAAAADASLEGVLQMKFFGTREDAAQWADQILSSEQGEYRSLVVHDAGNITLVLDEAGANL
eukprot:SAG22_NODE_859_length_6830_cov_2.134601_2_plen_432_part_00